MKQRILNTLIREIATHSALEETVVYPMIETKQNKGVADQMRAEHLAVKEALYQVDQIGYVTDPKIMGLLNQVMTRLTQHIEHGELDAWGPVESLGGSFSTSDACRGKGRDASSREHAHCRRAEGDDQQMEHGSVPPSSFLFFRAFCSNQVFCQMRPTVPTRPHPSAPDRPPMEIAAAAVATPMDKMKGENFWGGFSLNFSFSGTFLAGSFLGQYTDCHILSSFSVDMARSFVEVDKS